jgi:hypothetical protein
MKSYLLPFDVHLLKQKKTRKNKFYNYYSSRRFFLQPQAFLVIINDYFKYLKEEHTHICITFRKKTTPLHCPTPLASCQRKGGWGAFAVFYICFKKLQ